MNELAPAKSVPHLEVEQPRTYRLYRLVVEELLPPNVGGGMQYQNSGRCDHKLHAASIKEFINFAKLLDETDRAELKRVL